MFDDFEDKTEAPTAHRRAEARRAGNVARSSDLSAAGLMLAVACVLAIFSTSLIQACGELLQASLAHPGPLNVDRDWLARRSLELAVWLGRHALPPLLVLMGCAVAINLLQVGFLYSPDVLQPNLSRLSPVQGMRRIVSLRSLAKLGFGVAKLLLVVAIASWSVAQLLPEFLGLASLDWHAAGESGFFRTTAIVSIIDAIRGSGISVAFRLAAALLVLALLEFGFQKWKFERDLRMTRDELREELKHMQGDPLLRQRRREVHRKLAETHLSRVGEPAPENQA